jgi:hypothetical protein
VTLPRLVTEGYILYDEMSIFVTGMCWWSFGLLISDDAHSKVTES